MEMSPTINDLAAALAKAQGEMDNAVKDSENQFFKSKYPDLASVRAAIREPFATNGLSVVQSPSSEGHRVCVETLLLHVSGQWIKGTASASAKDDAPQSIGSAITYLRRYALQSFAGVAPEDDDGEAATARGNGHAFQAPAPQESAIPPTRVGRENTVAAPVGERAAPSDRPDPPFGYVYIDAYTQADNGWHDVKVGRTKYSTKTAVGRIAGEAFEMGRPVKIDSKPKENSPGEHWLNGVTVWTGEKGRTDDVIPF